MESNNFALLKESGLVASAWKGMKPPALSSPVLFPMAPEGHLAWREPQKKRRAKRVPRAPRSAIEAGIKKPEYRHAFETLPRSEVIRRYVRLHLGVPEKDLRLAESRLSAMRVSPGVADGGGPRRISLAEYRARALMPAPDEDALLAEPPAVVEIPPVGRPRDRAARKRAAANERRRLRRQRERVRKRLENWHKALRALPETPAVNCDV